MLISSSLVFRKQELETFAPGNQSDFYYRSPSKGSKKRDYYYRPFSFLKRVFLRINYFNSDRISTDFGGIFKIPQNRLYYRLNRKRNNVNMI